MSIDEAMRLWQEIYDAYEDRTRNQKIRLYTNAAGMDIFEECVEKEAGYKRIYLGKKVLRILRRLKNPIRTSHTGIFYKLIKS